MNPSPQHPEQEQLVDFGLGKLTDAESSEIEQHLHECDICSETLLQIKDDTFTGLLRTLPEPADDAEVAAETEQAEVSSAADQSPADTETADTETDESSPPEENTVSGNAPNAVGSHHEETLLVQSGTTDVTDELPEELRSHPRYEVQELIGQGGMGHVYRAQHRLMNRPVALKLISRALIEHPQAVERFRREVQAAAQLHHPNIVTAHDAEQAGDAHFLAMEFVDGIDLATLVKERGPLPVEEACEYIRQAAVGLQHASEKGMVHRDIKPHNLMVTTQHASGGEGESGSGGVGELGDGEQRSNDSMLSPTPVLPLSPSQIPPSQIKILDFGLASFATEEAYLEATAASESDTVDLHLTRIGSVMGTPDYIAPEQAVDAHSADIRADIYSLGCTLHFLLTGDPPFEADSVVDKLKAHAEADRPALSDTRDDVPPEVEAILQKMMAKDPADRYQTPADVAQALEELIESVVDRKLREAAGGGSDAAGRTRHLAGGGSRRRWVLLAILLLISVGAGGFLFRSEINHLWQGRTAELVVNITYRDATAVVFDTEGNRVEGVSSKHGYRWHFHLTPGEYWVRSSQKDDENRILLWRQVNIDKGDIQAVDVPERVRELVPAPVSVTVAELTAKSMTVEICNNSDQVVRVVAGNSRIYSKTYDGRRWPFRFDLLRGGIDGLKPGECRKQTYTRYSEIPPFVTTLDFDVLTIEFSDGTKWGESEETGASSNEVVFSFSENEDGPGTIRRFEGIVITDPDAFLARLKKLAAADPDLVVRLEGDVDLEGPEFLEKFETTIRAAGVRYIRLPPEIEQRRRDEAARQLAEERRRATRKHNLKLVGIALREYLGRAGEFPPSASVVPVPPTPRETSMPGGPSRTTGAKKTGTKQPEQAAASPPSVAGPGRSPDAFFDKNGRPHLSWRVHILPFFRQRELLDLYKQFRLDQPWDSPQNKSLLAKMPAIFKTTDDPTVTTLLAVVGEGTAYEGRAGLKESDMTDGLASLIYFVDAGAEKAVPWTKPEDLPFDRDDPIRAFGTSDFGDIFLAVMADIDSIIREIPRDIAPASLRALLTRAGNDVYDPTAKRTTPLPEAPETRHLKAIGGSTSPIRAAFVPDTPAGKRVVMLTGATTLQMWDAERDVLLWSKDFDVHTVEEKFDPPMRPAIGGGRIFVVSKDFIALATGGVGDRCALLGFHTDSGELFHLSGQHKEISELRILPDGKTLIVVAGGREMTYTIDLDGKVDVHTDFGKTAPDHDRDQLIQAVAPAGLTSLRHLDDKTIATGTDSGRIVLYDKANGRVQGDMTGHTDAVVQLSPAGEGRLVSASRDKTIRVWDIGSGRELTRLHIADGEYQWMDVSADGTRLLTPAASLETDQAVATTGKHQAHIWQLPESVWPKSPFPVGSMPYILTSDEYEWTEPVPVADVNSEDEEGGIWMAEDGLTFLFSSTRAGGSGAYDLWQSRRKRIDGEWSKPINLGPPVNSRWYDSQPWMSSDGRTLVFTSTRPGGQGMMDLWMSTRESVDDLWPEPVNLGDRVNTPHTETAAYLSDDGRHLVFYSNRGGTLEHWFTTREELDAEWSLPQRVIGGNDVLAGHPQFDAGRLLWHEDEKTVGLDHWDAGERRWTHTPFGPAINVGEKNAGPWFHRGTNTLYWHSNRPGGQGDKDLWMSRRVKKQSLDELKPIGQLEGHERTVIDLAWHPDGKRAVSIGSRDAEVGMWDVAERKTLWTWKPTRQVENQRDHYTIAVAISADGKRVAAGDADGTIYLLDVENGKELKSWPAYEDGKFTHAGIAALDFSPDGELLASVGRDQGTGKVWQLRTGKQVLNHTNGPDAFDIAFSQDGQAMISAGYSAKYREVDEDKDGLKIISGGGGTGHDLNLKASPCRLGGTCMPLATRVAKSIYTNERNETFGRRRSSPRACASIMRGRSSNSPLHPMAGI